MDETSEHYKRVLDFMVKGQQRIRARPGLPTSEECELRARLILEEALETVEALGCTVIGTSALSGALLKRRDAHLDVAYTHEPDLIEIVDGCCDIKVVTTGTLITCGVADEWPQAEVDRANLAKFGPGHIIRADGKVIKPPGHKPPDIARILKGLGYEPTHD